LACCVSCRSHHWHKSSDSSDTSLPNCALFYSLHDKSKPDPANTNGWSISRYRYFLYVCLGSFVWYWFPGFIWQGLSVFAFVTWIRPNNVVINQLFGGFTGLSLIPITFDWTYVTAYVLSPLIPPWHAIANTLIGVFLFTWICSFGIHYSGAWYSKYLPMSSGTSYDNTGAAYNVSRIITPQYTLDDAKYKEYSPLFLSTTFALQYGLSFATIISVIVHTGLFHWREIWYRAKAARTQEDDIHMRLMKKYKEAPDWWYVRTSVDNAPILTQNLGSLSSSSSWLPLVLVQFWDILLC
jgi:OPT family oligopeptide transporter